MSKTIKTKDISIELLSADLAGMLHNMIDAIPDDQQKRRFLEEMKRFEGRTVEFLADDDTESPPIS